MLIWSYWRCASYHVFPHVYIHCGYYESTLDIASGENVQLVGATCESQHNDRTK